VLAVGTTHPLNIAGVGLDAKVARELDVRIVTVVAGISAQNAQTVLARTPVDAATIAAQFEALGDVTIAAVHVGALLDAESVLAVAAGLMSLPGVPIVCDPVIAASGGDRLADDATIEALRGRLFRQCAVVTPNLDEAGQFLHTRILDVAAMESAAQALLGFGCGAALLKGGHLAGAPIDVLAVPGSVTRFDGDRVEATLRGTGDLLAGAIAARLAHGDDLVASISSARRFVRGCLSAGIAFAGTRTLP